MLKRQFFNVLYLKKFDNNKFVQLPKYYIGYGASAIVYGAIYKPLNKKVAVKIIDLDFFERNQIDEVRVLYIHHNQLSIDFYYILVLFHTL